MAAKTLAERMRERRAFWVELEPAADGKPPKRVQLLRPPETELAAVLAGFKVEHVVAAAVAWEGFTEEDLLGAGVGSTDAAPFSPEAWRELVLDSAKFASQAMGELTAAVVAHLEKVSQASGN